MEGTIKRRLQRCLLLGSGVVVMMALGYAFGSGDDSGNDDSGGSPPSYSVIVTPIPSPSACAGDDLEWDFSPANCSDQMGDVGLFITRTAPDESKQTFTPSDVNDDSPYSFDPFDSLSGAGRAGEYECDATCLDDPNYPQPGDTAYMTVYYIAMSDAQPNPVYVDYDPKGTPNPMPFSLSGDSYLGVDGTAYWFLDPNPPNPNGANEYIDSGTSITLDQPDTNLTPGSHTVEAQIQDNKGLPICVADCDIEVLKVCIDLTRLEGSMTSDFSGNPCSGRKSMP